jgi:hypothetical protein
MEYDVAVDLKYISPCSLHNSCITVGCYSGLLLRFSSRGSVLITVPFYKCSKQDVEVLNDHILNSRFGLYITFHYSLNCFI